MKLKFRNFLPVAFTLSGTTIGAGILGLPYAFAKSGFFVGLCWLVALGALMLYLNLCLGEVSLRTEGRHHLLGYAEKYLGKNGKRVMFLAIFFEIYSALLAYLIGEGQSLSRLFFGTQNYSLIFGIGFWFVLSLFVYGGIRRLKKVEYWGVSFLLVTLVLIFVLLVPNVQASNLISLNWTNIFLPFGIVLFSLLGFTSIPNLREEVSKNKKILKKSIILGTLIPIVAYALFAFVFVGVLGGSIDQVATNSFSGLIGKLLTLLGALTMTTAFFVLSFALRDIVDSDLKERKFAFLIVSMVPLVLYLLVSIFNIAGFASVLGIGGAVSGGALGILILLMNIKSKKKSDRKPEYKVPIHWLWIILLSLIFVGGILVQVLG